MADQTKKTATDNVVPLLTPEQPLHNLMSIFAAASENDRIAFLDCAMAALSDKERERFLERHDLVYQSDVEAYYEDELDIAGRRRPRGPKPEKLNAVIARMGDSSHLPRLAEMKETEMETVFGASRDTCRRARKEVLGGSAK